MVEKKRTYKMPEEEKPLAVAESATVYGDIDTLKEELVNEIMQIDSTQLLQYLHQLICRAEKTKCRVDTVEKQRVLNALHEALIEFKEEQEGKAVHSRNISELLNEL